MLSIGENINVVLKWPPVLPREKVFSTLTLVSIKYMFAMEDYTTSRKVAGSIPDEVIGFFNLPNSSSQTMALGSNQPLEELSTRNLPGGRGRPVLMANNLTAICEPIV
jgi:hypothetical protein